jgi:hypothetical protein
MELQEVHLCWQHCRYCHSLPCAFRWSQKKVLAGLKTNHVRFAMSIYIYHSDQNQEAEWRNVLFEVLELHELCVHATSEISLLWMSWLSYILWMSLQPCISSAADCTKCTLRIGVPIEFCSGCLWLMEPKYSACTVHPRTVSICIKECG